MCVWHGTRKPAGNSCSGEGRPAVIRSCKDNKPCPKSNDLPGLFKGWRNWRGWDLYGLDPTRLAMPRDEPPSPPPPPT